MCYSAIIKKRAKELGFDVEIRSDFEFWDQFYDHQRKEPAKFKEAAEDGRIFPHYFAPVLAFQNDGYAYAPMRYQLFPSAFKNDPKHLSLFNARRDNLLESKIWNPLLSHGRGLVFLESFFEWVEVRDLVKGGVVSLKQVEEKFASAELEKKKICLASGKKYKPSKTALTPAIDRKIEIQFQPNITNGILAPVIFDKHRLDDGFEMYSFALLTDEPQPEVAAAGHDRSPIFLKPDAALGWLNPETKVEDALRQLDTRQTVFFAHRLADVA